MTQVETLGCLYIVIVLSILFAVFAWHQNNDDDFNF